MKRKLLALLTVALMLVAMMAFAGPAFAQAEEGCQGVETAVLEAGADPPADPEPPPVFSPAFNCFPPTG